MSSNRQFRLCKQHSHVVSCLSTSCNSLFVRGNGLCSSPGQSGILNASSGLSARIRSSDLEWQVLRELHVFSALKVCSLAHVRVASGDAPAFAGHGGPGTGMLAKLLDALFGCRHTHYTFPISVRPGIRRSQAYPSTGIYVACLNCGRELPYDWNEMRVISPIPKRPHR